MVQVVQNRWPIIYSCFTSLYIDCLHLHLVLNLKIDPLNIIFELGYVFAFGFKLETDPLNIIFELGYVMD